MTDTKPTPPGQRVEPFSAVDGGFTPYIWPVPDDFDIDAPIPLVPNDSPSVAGDDVTAAAVADRLDTLAAEFDQLAARLRRQAATIRETQRATGLH